MQIFNAWSINPEVLKELIERKIELLHYKDEEYDYKINMQDARDHGFEKTFSGGETFYIPIKFWDKQIKNQLTII